MRNISFIVLILVGLVTLLVMLHHGFEVEPEAGKAVVPGAAGITTKYHAYEIDDFIFNAEYKGSLATWTMDFRLLTQSAEAVVVIKSRIREITAALAAKLPDKLESLLGSESHFGLLNRDIQGIINDVINDPGTEPKWLVERVVITEFLLKEPVAAD